jgi:hypothetical protein
MNLLIKDSDNEASDDEDILDQSQTAVSAHFAAANSYRFIFREPNYRPDVRRAWTRQYQSGNELSLVNQIFSTSRILPISNAIL